MAQDAEIGKLSSVSYDGETDEVFVTFKINDEEYKDFVLRWARQEEGRLLIRGTDLFLSQAEGQMRVSKREH